MPLLTLEEQFIQEVHELLEYERLLAHQIPLITGSAEALSIEFLRSYLSRKYDHVEALEEILRSLNRDVTETPACKSSFSNEMDALIRVCEARHASLVGALQQIAEMLLHQYKHVRSHAQILGWDDAEDLLESARVNEANLCIALTNFEFHHPLAELEDAAG